MVILLILQQEAHSLESTWGSLMMLSLEEGLELMH